MISRTNIIKYLNNLYLLMRFSFLSVTHSPHGLHNHPPGKFSSNGKT